MQRLRLSIRGPVKLKTRLRQQTGRHPRSTPEVSEAFMRVGDEIQCRHIAAFKRLADR